MVKQNKHGRWFVEGTKKLWPTEKQALIYQDLMGLSAPLQQEVEVVKKGWWKR